ncbi:hypothetical protein [Sporosarcina sp. E16_3]|nr:hypothetical protein [Sporosarcina sp. E16_3]
MRQLRAMSMDVLLDREEKLRASRDEQSIGLPMKWGRGIKEKA